jgi:hypothetical protein
VKDKRRKIYKRKRGKKKKTDTRTGARTERQTFDIARIAR